MTSPDIKNEFQQFLDTLTSSSRSRIPEEQFSQIVHPDEQHKYDFSASWHLITIRPDEIPEHRSCHDLLSLRTEIAACQKEEDSGGDIGRARFFIIFGRQAFITRPPFSHLIHPDGSAIALYEKPQHLEIVPDGYSGDEETRVIIEEGDVSEEPFDPVSEDDYDSDYSVEEQVETETQDEEAYADADEYEEEGGDVADQEPD